MVKQQLAYMLFPRYSLLFDRLLNNALLGEWIGKNKGTPKHAKRDELHAAVSERLGNVPIHYLEFGVWKGESIKGWTKLNTHPDSRFFGFDSFEGLPEDWTGVFGKGAFDVGGVAPDLTDDRVKFVKGWFQDTLPVFLAGYSTGNRTLVVHIDADLHSSAIYALTKLDDFIKPGTIVIFDEFASAMHEFRAFNDYCRAYRRDMQPIGMTADFATRAAFVVKV